MFKKSAIALAMIASTVTGSMAADYGWTTAGVNFRSGPGTYYEVLGKISPCVKVTIESEDNHWYHVSWSGHEGWVAAKYVTYDSSYCDSYEAPVYHKPTSSY
jgi:uncharacterized protein YraI